MARKLPKAPKKPKASASPETWARFDQRVKDWRSKCKSIVASKKKKEAIIKKYTNGVKL